MRVYRDTRFSRNKLPYKTNIGIQFRHESAKDVRAPGYYVHVAPDEVFRGFDKAHPCSDDIRRTSFIAIKDLDSQSCLSPRFRHQVETAFRSASPFMQFLCKAVGVPF